MPAIPQPEIPAIPQPAIPVDTPPVIPVIPVIPQPENPPSMPTIPQPENPVDTNRNLVPLIPTESDIELNNNNNKSRRKDFTAQQINIKKEKIKRCPLMCTLFNSKIGAPLYDIDHKDGDSSNNSDDNCNPLSVIAHRIKTKGDIEEYDELLNDDEKRLEFLKDFIYDMIEGMKTDGLINKDNRNVILGELLTNFNK